MYGNQISAESFQIFIKSIKNGTFMDLLQLKAFYEEIIIPIFKSKQNRKVFYRQYLCKLVAAVKAKLKPLPKGQMNIFPGIYTIIAEIQKFIGPNDITLQFELKSPLDQHFVNFLKNQQARLQNPDDSSYYDAQVPPDFRHKYKIKMRMPILLSSVGFPKEWQNLFQTIHENYKILRYPQVRTLKNHAYEKFRDNKFSYPLCLGCTEFYYERVNIKILQISQMDLIVVPKFQNLNMDKDFLKKSICALMNSNGGIILFDCLEEYMQVLPVGTSVTEMNKEHYLQQISQILGSFYPKLAFGVNVDVNFVPVAENPFEQIKDTQSVNFIKGQYVIRLRVWSKERYMLTSVKNGVDDLAIYTRKEEQKFKGMLQNYKIPGKMLARYIKKNFNKFYCPQNCKKEINQLPQNVFQNHKCHEPKMGIQSEKKQRQQKQIFNQYDCEQQNTYKNISFVFFQSENPEKFILTLKLILSNQNLYIIPHNPPTHDNFCIMFHDSPYREMKVKFKAVVDSQIAFSKKKDHSPFPVLLFVQNALQLEKELSEKSFNELAKYIKKKTSTQSLRYFQKEGHYYITAHYKVTLFFLFAKLIQMNFRHTKVIKLELEGMQRFQYYRVSQNVPKQIE